MAELFLTVSLFALYYIYHGYLLLLRCVLALRPPAPTGPESFVDSELPKLSVLVTAYNEKAVIKDRIANILACSYPSDRLQVVVASDLSSDGMDQVVRLYPDSRVQLFRPSESAGKTDTQNQAVEYLNGDIWVFTDADTRFRPDFLKILAVCFADAEVGGADGHLIFCSQTTGMGQAQSSYWRYELSLRDCESRLGILAVGSGACLGIRAELFQTMPVGIGEDCVLPLQVVNQGYRMVHVPEAVAEDWMESGAKNELRSRIRMTQRNWRGTWTYPQLLNPLRHPGYAWSLWSHKLLRWLSPVFLVFLTLSGLWLTWTRPWGWVSGTLLGAFYFSASMGWFAQRKGWRWPIAGSVFGFVLANIGFLAGVLLACFSPVEITSYRRSR